MGRSTTATHEVNSDNKKNTAGGSLSGLGGRFRGSHKRTNADGCQSSGMFWSVSVWWGVGVCVGGTTVS